MVGDNQIKSPQNLKHPSQRGQDTSENGQKNCTLFSPRFRSVAALAGWDEEAILAASLVVEDTPERDSSRKKRSNFQQFKTPPTSSRRKRRAQRKSPISSLPVAVLDLDEDETITDEKEKKMTESKVDADVEKRTTENKSNAQGSSDSPSSSSISCIDRLREELSCAICLEICFEPSTTPCGHSFCKKCLRSAADKCGRKCPKCRQLISNGRSCTVNTVLWNTIQLLFPREVEDRKAAAALKNRPEAKRQSPPRVSHYNARNRSVLALNSPESEDRNSGRRRRSHGARNRTLRSSGGTITREIDGTSRRGLPSQDEDAALALRLQREEFMEAFRLPDEQQQPNTRRSLASARANLRAMASRAMDIRIRSRESRT